MFFTTMGNLNFSKETVVCTDKRLPSELKNLKLSDLKNFGNFQKPLLYSQQMTMQALGNATSGSFETWNGTAFARL